MKDFQIILAQSAWRAGWLASEDGMQRVVPSAYLKYESFWLNGFDGKPQPEVSDLRKQEYKI